MVKPMCRDSLCVRGRLDANRMTRVGEGETIATDDNTKAGGD